MDNKTKNRICFFDASILEASRTTATIRLHHPVNRGVTMECHEDWEGDGCYASCFFDKEWHGVNGDYAEGTYRMYYVTHPIANDTCKVKFPGCGAVCYAESPDGIHWVKPMFRLYEAVGCQKNNVVVHGNAHPELDNFMVFRDENPDCPPLERYKGVGAFGWVELGVRGKFGYFASPDGIRFTNCGELDILGNFDSLNVVFWDKGLGAYRGYIRALHARAGETDKTVRDVRLTTSKDFHTWTIPEPLAYDDGLDLAMYTNNIEPYFRATGMFLGFPTRYNERQEWNGSFQELCGRELRRTRMELATRCGLAITDCTFMSSRDGFNFHRFNEAFVRPEPENGRNWTYGDCYMARGVLQTKSSVPGAPDELSFYAFNNHWTGIRSQMERYTIRMDGFASLHADGEEVTAVTKPFEWKGGDLFVNFATSAWGHIFFTLVTEDGQRIESCETFGNTTDRKVVFDSALPPVGTKVTLEIRLLDADLYSMTMA